jgi:hypothetical protein
VIELGEISDIDCKSNQGTESTKDSEVAGEGIARDLPKNNCHCLNTVLCMSAAFLIFDMMKVPQGS